MWEGRREEGRKGGIVVIPLLYNGGLSLTHLYSSARKPFRSRWSLGSTAFKENIMNQDQDERREWRLRQQKGVGLMWGEERVRLMEGSDSWRGMRMQRTFHFSMGFFPFVLST